MFCEKCGGKLDKNIKFCPTCGNALFPTETPPTTVTDKKKLKKKSLIWLLSPVVAFLGIIVIWGLMNVFFEQDNVPEAIEFINAILIPFFFGLIFLCSPITIAISIYYYLKSKR